MRSDAEGRPAPPWLKAAAAGVVAFLHLPFLVVVLYCFSTDDSSYQFPPPGWTLRWFEAAWNRPDLWRALGLSLRVAFAATALALVLGTMAAAAIHRSRFFGRETISLLFLLPIALPGIVTGIALRSATSFLGLPLGVWTVVIGHATFCIVVVYNNVVARMRRIARSQVEASMDLGAAGHQTFRHVLLPQLATALLAGGMLALALSFDEIIVTTFTAGPQETLPIWIYAQLTKPRQRPITNVVAVFVVLATAIPVLLAHRLTRDDASR